MRWSRATVQPVLNVRSTVLDEALEDALRRRHPGFRPSNDDRTAAGGGLVIPQGFACSPAPVSPIL
jgi:hypothetical protein